MNPSTVNELLEGISSRLANVSETPLLDAQVLIAHILDKPRTWVLAHPESYLTPQETERLECSLSQIENGIPLPYVLGSWEFFGRQFLVTPDVLIPRPETELLVEKALSWLFLRTKNHPDINILSADVGCGSGCIGITLAANFNPIRVLASDISFSALRVASQNAFIHSVHSRLDFVRCHLLPSISQKFDLICANLPYIPTHTLHSLEVHKKEPTIALDGGPDGLKFIKPFLSQSSNSIKADGLILLEIESSQCSHVLKLARAFLPKASIELIQDIAHHDRLISIQQGK
ncbi:MAG: peptide chain release factor N(5)-glutamine methyltransferase [Anaerolineaceae bacterium]